MCLKYVFEPFIPHTFEDIPVNNSFPETFRKVWKCSKVSDHDHIETHVFVVTVHTIRAIFVADDGEDV